MGDVELTDQERRFLRAAMLEWGGASSPTNAIAVALGFMDAMSLPEQAWELWLRIERGELLDTADWGRVLLAAEVVFASDVVGSGVDWAITTGIPDAEAIAILRGIQRKLPNWRGSVQYSVGDGHVSIADQKRAMP